MNIVSKMLHSNEYSKQKLDYRQTSWFWGLYGHFSLFLASSTIDKCAGIKILQKICTFYAIFTGSMNAKHKNSVTVYWNILHVLECICGEFESKIQHSTLTRLTAFMKSFFILSSSSKTSNITSKCEQCVYVVRHIALRCAGSGSRDGPVQPQKRNNRPAFWSLPGFITIPLY